jgi:hypothetical protein
MRNDGKSLLSLGFPASRSGRVWKDATFGTWGSQVQILPLRPFFKKSTIQFPA